MLGILSKRIIFSYKRFSKPSKIKPIKRRQQTRSLAMDDQKAAKLSKSQQVSKLMALEQQKISQQTIKQINAFRSHQKSLQDYNILTTKKKKKVPQLLEQNARYLITDMTTLSNQNQRIKKYPVYGNYTKIINKQFQSSIKQIQGKQHLRRVGTLGIKLGMTSMWNRWGNHTPVTIIELDRVQIVQIKQPVLKNQFYQVQLGIGQKNNKRITKSLLGHFLKAGVPPKRILAQFKVSKQCLLPIGYMMSVRHFTPGMFVDVISKSVGHGFQGTIKRYGFHRQPQTHGNSLTTRVLGATGSRQDPGRVFKQKKMYGRMGGKIAVQTGLAVFMIDVDKNILYLKGSVPGKPGTVVRIRDTLNKNRLQKNLEIVQYPTFIQKQGVEYAKQFSMYCGARDPQSIEVHDNAYIIDDDEKEEEAPVGGKGPKETEAI